MPYKIFYQVCKYPHESYRNKYLVRKFIYDDSTNKLIKKENYVYGERNLNKLNKEIIKMNYFYESIEANNFDNIAFPSNK
jgi:hypothetical protein